MRSGSHLSSRIDIVLREVPFSNTRKAFLQLAADGGGNIGAITTGERRSNGSGDGGDGVAPNVEEVDGPLQLMKHRNKMPKHLGDMSMFTFGKGNLEIT